MKINISLDHFSRKKSDCKELIKIMKISLLFLFAFTFQLMALDSNAQDAVIEIKRNSVTIGQLINEIEKQTDYLVVYSNREVDTNRKVDFRQNSDKVSSYLHTAFSNTDIGYNFENDYIILSKKANQNTLDITRLIEANQQQGRSITGKVTDENGEPVIGATIVVKDNPSHGTITDVDGYFSLTNISENSTLQFTYVGMKTQEIALKGQTTIHIIMESDVELLDEVVVVGYGTQKKINLTGAVSQISGEELLERPVSNIAMSLQSKIPGLNISQITGTLNASPSVNIRGTGTIGAGSTAKPLILIDGAEGSLEFINSQDIESISVLKDAAASSIYGSRAPFGVILITTKKGKLGRPNLNYANNFRWTSIINTPKIMDSYTFSTFVNDASVNSNASPFVTEERLQRIKDYKDGKITTVNIPNPNNPQYWANGNSFANANTNIYEAFYKKHSPAQDHNISLSGGNEIVSYYTSLGILTQHGMLNIGKDKYQRFTPMGKIDIKINNWLSLNYTSRFVRTNYSRPTSLDGSSFFANWARVNWPWLPIYDDNGYISIGSPMLGVLRGDSKDEIDNYNNRASIIFSPMNNWRTVVDVNYNVESLNRHTVSRKTYNHDVNGEPYDADVNSSVGNSWKKNNYLNINAHSTYSHTINEQHHIKTMIGMQYENLKESSFGLNRKGIIVDDLPVVDLTTGLDGSGTPSVPSVNGKMAEWGTAGYFGRINYDYNEKYLAEINLRYDGSSRFRSNRRWAWFPSFSVGWNMAKESFWSDLSTIVNTFKLRGSYGTLGNQNTNNWYPTYQVLSVNTNAGQWLQNGLLPNIASAPALITSTLTWEKIKSWNMGLDIGAFQNRLTASFDTYNRKTLDMMGPAIELPNILGVSVPQSNNTDLKTYGFELEVGWNDYLANGLSYGIRFLLSDYQTKITRYPNATNSLSTHYEGKILGDIWGYETIGIAKTAEEMQQHLASLQNGGQNAFGSQWSAGDIMYKDLNGDGLISSGSNTLDDPGDKRIIGNSTPRYQFGIDLNASWKGFDVSLFFQGIAKRDYWNGSPAFFGSNRANMWFIIGLKEHTDYFRPEPSNDLPINIDSYYPRPLLSDKNLKTQTRYLQDASYIRLKNVNVGYTLPKKMSSKFYVSRLRLFFSGENLWTGTKLAKMFDPEGIDGNDSKSGIGYPLYKTLSFGLNMTL